MAKSVLFAMLLAACGGSSQSSTATTTPPPATAAADPTCPVEVPGTSVTTEDTATGAALVFVTTGDTGELRKRVATLAAMHNEHHAAMGPLPTGDEQGGGHAHHDHAAMHGAQGGDHAGSDHAMGGMIGVHSKAVAEDVEGGAKLVFVAFPDGVAKLQGELRMHAQHLASGTCKMDHHH